MTIDVERALEHLAKLREETGVKVTVTHFVGRVVALALRAAPGLNGVIRLGRFIPHPWVNVTFLWAACGTSRWCAMGRLSCARS